MKKRSLFVLITLAGVLIFAATTHASVRTGTIVAAPVTVGDSTNTFPTAYEDEINGGYKVVSDEATMNSIPASRRVVGMLCYVSLEATTFRLNKNGNWVSESTTTAGGWIKGGNQITLETLTNNVGIGTSDASDARLVVRGTSWSKSFVFIKDKNDDAGLRIYSDDATVAHHIFNWYNSGANILKIAPNNGYNNGIYIPQNGNVGIASSNPIATLEVNGDMRITATPTPSDQTAGKIYFSSATKRMNYSDGTQWIELDPAYTTKEVEHAEISSASKGYNKILDASNNPNGIVITNITGITYVSGSDHTSHYFTANLKIGGSGGVNKAYIYAYHYYCDNTSYGLNSDRYREVDRALTIPVKVPANTEVGFQANGDASYGTGYDWYLLQIHYIELPF